MYSAIMFVLIVFLLPLLYPHAVIRWIETLEAFLAEYDQRRRHQARLLLGEQYRLLEEIEQRIDKHRATQEQIQHDLDELLHAAAGQEAADRKAYPLPRRSTKKETLL